MLKLHQCKVIVKYQILLETIKRLRNHPTPKTKEEATAKAKQWTPYQRKGT